MFKSGKQCISFYGAGHFLDVFFLILHNVLCHVSVWVQCNAPPKVKHKVASREHGQLCRNILTASACKTGLRCYHVTALSLNRPLTTKQRLNLSRTTTCQNPLGLFKRKQSGALLRREMHETCCENGKQ